MSYCVLKFKKYHCVVATIDVMYPDDIVYITLVHVMTCHYPNQHWLIVNWTHKKWNLKQYMNIFIGENALDTKLFYKASFIKILFTYTYLFFLSGKYTLNRHQPSGKLLHITHGDILITFGIIEHYNDITSASWCLKSLEIPLFVHQLFEVDIKENSNLSDNICYG